MCPARAYRLEALDSALSHAPRCWTRPEIEARWSRGTLQKGVARGLVVRIAHGLYCSRDHAHHPELLIDAASKWAGPEGTITGMAALRRWGLSGHPTRFVDVDVPRRMYRQPPAWIRLYRTDIRAQAYLIGGVRIAKAEEAVLRAWGTAPPADRTGIVLDAIRELSLGARQIAAIADRLPRIPGRRKLDRLLDLASGGITSYLEHSARTEVFTGSRWADMEWQAKIHVGERRFVIDMLHPVARVAVEFDGARYHSNDAARRRDIERDAALAAAGYVTIRLTYEDIMFRQEQSRVVVWRAIQARIGGVAGSMRAAVQPSNQTRRAK